MKTPNARTLRSIFAVICLLGLAAFLLIESRLVLRYFADRSAELDRMELQFAYVLDCRHALDLVMTAAPEELPQKLNELERYWIDFYGTQSYGYNVLKGTGA